MDWRNVFFGLVQGLTEFLPVSSSGHLFLMDQFLQGNQSTLSFVVLLHLATFFSILVVFFKDIKSFVVALWQKTKVQLLLKILLTLVPVLFVGLFFKVFVQQSFEKNTVALGFFSTACLLLSLLFIRKKQGTLDDMSYLQAFLIGLAQALAVFPGFSRSAWTICAGLYCGLAPRSAVYLSFLISLPTIAGTALMAFGSNQLANTSSFTMDFSGLLLAFLVAFLSGCFSLLLVLKMVQNWKFHLFFFYLLPLSLVVFLFL